MPNYAPFDYVADPTQKNMRLKETRLIIINGPSRSGKTTAMQYLRCWSETIMRVGWFEAQTHDELVTRAKAGLQRILRSSITIGITSMSDQATRAAIAEICASDDHAPNHDQVIWMTTDLIGCTGEPHLIRDGTLFGAEGIAAMEATIRRIFD